MACHYCTAERHEVAWTGQRCSRPPWDTGEGEPTAGRVSLVLGGPEFQQTLSPPPLQRLQGWCQAEGTQNGSVHRDPGHVAWRPRMRWRWLCSLCINPILRAAPGPGQ